MSLWTLSASELASAYADRQLSPVEVLDAVLAQSETVNPRINAIVTFDFEGARRAARDSEARWRSGQARGPLDGIPITVKDNIPVRGLRTTWGSRVLGEYVPDADELPVARLRAAGAVIFGKTNVPEFTLQGYTDNSLFGTTRNPWDARLTPGGSSGGAVAAVAAGLGPLAIGTDGGGSIRRPAGHTGLVGLKPSTGRVARTHGLPVILHDFEVIGPIARTTADAAMLFAAIAGPDPHDRASLAFPERPRCTLEDPPPLRILYVPRFGGAPVDPEIAANVAEATRRLEALGHRIEEGDAPFDLAALDRIWGVVGAAGLAWFLEGKPGWERLIGEKLRPLAEHGAALRAADYVDALDKVTQIRAQLADAFERHNAILTPSFAALPWTANVTHPETIDGQPVGPRGHAVFTAFANAGGLPGISFPCRPSRSGLPVGVQVVGPYGGDERLLQLAAQYERAHPWANRWPAID
ncbi:amidase [Microvirga massiliensis]|uniref:amidase n=1 Tax=Microvirga massiliensis TaxID=1033741 RepID=UPI00062BC7A3|nr:amidase [Microvirga massiliensis]